MKPAFCISVLAILFSSLIGQAQDAHYWTEQYGTRSMLLSNSIIGSVEDLGAVFYNPARLGVIDNPAFVISAKVHQLSNTTIENATGDNANLKKSSFGGAPSLVAGTFKVNWLENHKFAYSFLTRRRSDVNVGTRDDIYGDVITGWPGEEYFSGQVALGKKFSEEWLGLTWSYPLSDRFSIGLSSYLSVREQSADIRMQLQALSEPGDVEVYINNRNYSFSHYGLLAKLGLAWEYERLKLGVTLTSPTISVMGDGSFHYEFVYTGITDQNPAYEIDLQSGLPAKYRTPLAIGIGAGIRLYKGTLHLSGEYYSGVKEYTLVQGEPFTGQSTGSVRQPKVTNELNQVANYGVGYNIAFSEKVSAYASYSTDFSAAVGSNSFENGKVDFLASTFVSNINHFGAGIVLDFKRADITLGATNAWARYTIDRPIDFPGEGNSGRIINSGEDSTVKWSRWRFIVGISVPFLEDLAKKWEKKLNGEGNKKDKTEDKSTD
jgi:hypothetical protein